MRVLIGLVLTFAALPLRAVDTVKVSKSYDAESVSEWFYGSGKPKALKKRLALSLGRVDIQIPNRMSCGRLVGAMRLDASLGDLSSQMSEVSKYFKGIFDKGNLDSLVFATICYYKPNVCAHVRHFASSLQNELNLQFDACQAIDSMIETRSEKTEKNLQAESYKKCVAGKAKGGGLTPRTMSECEGTLGETKNLLKPLSDSPAGKDQNVLESILKVIKKSENQAIWTSLFGEVHLLREGKWVEAYPKGLLRPEDATENALSESQGLACDLKRLRSVINSSPSKSGTKDLGFFVQDVIRERIGEKTVFDLESLPEAERERACQSLGDGVSLEALRNLVSEGKSDMAAALANPNLPEDLKIFYREKSETTFAAIEKRALENNKPSLPETLRMIGRYGREFRSLSREKASEISKGRLSNSTQAPDECRDPFSCKKGD